jgi:amidophosphoribosyltransferase
MPNKPSLMPTSDDKLSEKCGVFGVYDKGVDVARLVHPALWALQHRGQESSGIATADGKTIHVFRGMGLVAHVYDEKSLKTLKGYIGIGHNRYATSHGSSTEHSQPVVTRDHLLALAHNGNIPSTRKLEKFLKSKGIPTSGHNDSELMHAALKFYYVKGLSIEEAVTRCFPLFTGVFSLLIMTRDKLVAVRDECGIRPLSLAKINGGYAFASETCAFDTIKADFIREVNPGEMVVVDNKGVNSYQLVKPNQKLDIFEFVYFARPDSVIMGKSVNEVRRNFGKILAEEYTIDADVVIPVPDSAIPAALGYAQASGIPFDHGLIKNRYIHRTFIRPTQRLRENDVQLKLNPIPEVLRGKRVVVVDDSIVRGTTSKKLIDLIRNAGAKEVHLLISSPPVRYPDFYGINTPDQNDLIAAKMSVDEITKFIGADSVCYLSYDGMIRATCIPEDQLSTSCFSGIYPINIHERSKEVTEPIKQIVSMPSKKVEFVVYENLPILHTH